MPSNNSTAGFEAVAQTTIDLLEFKQTPDVISDAIVASLAALYSMYERGAGFRRMRLYGEYEAGRLYRRRLKNK